MRNMLSQIMAILGSFVWVVEFVAGIPLRILKMIVPAIPPSPPPIIEQDEETQKLKLVTETAAVQMIARSLLSGTSPPNELVDRLLPDTARWLLNLQADALELLCRSSSLEVSAHLAGTRRIDGLPHPDDASANCARIAQTLTRVQAIRADGEARRRELRTAAERPVLRP